MLTRVEPTALQRGQTAEVTISGTGNFAGAWQILCEGPGLAGEVVGPEEKDVKRMRPAKATVKARLTATTGCPWVPVRSGSRRLRGRHRSDWWSWSTARSSPRLTTKGTISPGVQMLSLPVTATGSIGKVEDVDWYAFEAAAGQRVTFRIWGNRLEEQDPRPPGAFDPILLLHDAPGRELAADDNHDFADPMLSYAFPEAGRYLLQVRDTTYSGNASWTYVLEATAGPYATSVFPLAVNPGATARVRAEGFNLDSERAIALEVPAGTSRGPWLTALATGRAPRWPCPWS